MFTGIIEELAKVENVQELENFYTVKIASIFSDKMKVGDSIAINGVCLTATDLDNGCFIVDIVKETLDKSSLRGLTNQSYVNLERSMKVSSRIDGHIVQGHVECVGKIIAKESSEDGWVDFEISFDKYFLKYCIYKGSITLDGISLTIANLYKDSFCVSIIPHTYNTTNLLKLDVDDVVNLEFDMLSRYVLKNK